MQVRGAAELQAREVVAAAPKEFNFKEYMVKRAQLVNEALDKAVPLQYPEAVTEAMRCALLLFNKHSPSRGDESMQSMLG